MPRFSQIRSVHVAVSIIFIIAIGVRVLSVFNDLWLDEIWSLQLAKSIRSPWDLFTQIHHDNNHWLNTFFMSLLGEQKYWFLYRLPSLFAGFGSVALAGLIASRRGRLESIVTLLLFGLSYLQILYSTEARGYGLVVFFSLLSYDFMRRFMEKKDWVSSSLFGLSAMLGFLSHLTFGHVYFALFLWSLHRFDKESTQWTDLSVNLLRCHTAPMILLVVLYFLDIRHLQIGGGPDYSLSVVILDTGALALGVGDSRLLSLLAFLLVTVVFISGVIWLWREGNDQWIFFATAIGLAPALCILWLRPEVLFVRYFLVSVTFFLLLLSYLIGYYYRQHWQGKAICAGIILLVSVGNANQIVDFLPKGRGHYREALNYMAEQTDGDRITIGSDHDFRNQTVLDFYSRYLPQGKQVVYFDKKRWNDERPQWFITHHQRRDYQPASDLSVNGYRYLLDQEYRYSGLSGWHWFVYRRLAR